MNPIISLTRLYLKKIGEKIAGLFARINVLLLLMMVFPEVGNATSPSGPSVGTVATTVTSSFSNLAKLITASAYIAGMGFALSAILKFKQHKDNPQQVPIGTPIALLFIGAALIFLPTIFGVAGQTIFGSGASAGGTSGVST